MTHSPHCIAALQLGGAPHAVVFSAGIGENSAEVRAAVLAGLEHMGLELDLAANERMVHGACGEIQAPGSRVKVLVIPTDEERSIAQQTLAAVAAAQGEP